MDIWLKSATIIHLNEGTFLKVILKTGVKFFCQTLGVYLIRDFSGNDNKQLKFIVCFLLFFKTVL